MRKKNKLIVLLLIITITASFLCLDAFATSQDSDTATPGEQTDAPSQQSSEKKPAASSSAASSQKNDTTSLENKLSKLKKESDTIKKELNGLTAEKRAEQQNLEKIQIQVTNLEEQIYIVEKQVTDLDLEIISLEKEIDNKKVLIDEKEIELIEKELEYDESYQLFKDRVRTMYMTSDASTLGMILGAESMGDFLEKSEMVKRVAESDQETMEILIGIRKEIEADKLLIENEKISIEQNKEKVEINKIEAEKKRDELGSTKDELDLLSKEVEANIVTIANKEQNVRLNYEQTQEQIEAMESEIKRLIAENASAAGSEYVGGQFIWPVPGYYKISCAYKGYPGHSGMDITGNTSGAINGQPFVAAGKGKVIVVVRGHTGYGHYVIVDHGGGYTTLYAHASSISVSKGQEVEAGTPLGTVGSTGNSSGPHLHFEVRINGAHQNPAGFLKGK